MYWYVMMIAIIYVCQVQLLWYNVNTLDIFYTRNYKHSLMCCDYDRERFQVDCLP